MAEANLFPQAGEGCGSGSDFFGRGIGFLGKFGEVFHSESFFHGAVLMKVLKFGEMLGSVEIQERLRIGGSKLGAFQTEEEFPGAASVCRNGFVQVVGSRRRVECAEWFGVIVEWVDETGDVFFWVLVFDERGEIFRRESGKITCDDEPFGVWIALKSGLQTTEWTG